MVTAAVLKLERSRVVRAEAPANIELILITAAVLKLERSRVVRAETLENI